MGLNVPRITPNEFDVGKLAKDLKESLDATPNGAPLEQTLGFIVLDDPEFENYSFKYVGRDPKDDLRFEVYDKTNLKDHPLQIFSFPDSDITPEA